MNNVTLFRAFQNDKDQGRVNPPAGKVWRKNLKTKAVTKTSAPKCSTFDITRASVQNLDELRQLLLSLDKSHAVTWSTPDDPDAVTVVPDQRAKSDEGEVGRTNANFSWPAGLGVLMLDIDPPKYAAVSPLPLPLEDWTPENVIDAIEAAVPELTGLSWLYRPSSSSFVYDVQEDKWVTRLRGFRLYAMVDDARKIPDIGKLIFKRLFIDGRGFVASSSGGSLLVRGLIDASVWQTSRFDFAGPPSCSKALEWRGNAETVVSEGDMAMIITADLPAWSDDEEVAFLAKRDEIASSEPFATDMRKIGIEHHSETERESAKERGENLSEDQLAERAAKRYAEAGAGKLYGIQPIEVLDYGRSKAIKALGFPRDNDGTVVVTVQDIIDNPEVFDGALTRDPLDPDYHDGAQVGKLYTSGDMLILSSQAHGGVKYSLERVSAEDVMNEFRAAMPTSSKTQTKPKKVKTVETAEPVTSSKKLSDHDTYLKEYPLTVIGKNELIKKTKAGVYLVHKSKTTDDGTSMVPVYQPFEIVGHFEEVDSPAITTMIRYRNTGPGGVIREHEYELTRAFLAKKTSAEELGDLNFECLDTRDLIDALKLAPKNPTFRFKRGGQYELFDGECVFVGLDGSIYGNRKSVGHLDPALIDPAFELSGTLEGWHEGLRAAKKRDMDHLVIGAVLGLTSPILELVGLSSYVVEIIGSAGGGKSSTQAIAGSCWGVANFREVSSSATVTTASTTKNALFAGIAKYSGHGFHIDETKTADNALKQQLPSLAFEVSGGVGRSRLNQAHTLSQGQRFTNLVSISTELPLIDLAKEAGYRGELVQGVYARTAQLYVEQKFVADFHKAIGDPISENYGHAGPLLLNDLYNRSYDDLQELKKKLLEAYESHVSELTEAVKEYGNGDTEVIQKRMAYVYASMMLSAEYCIDCEILPDDIHFVEIIKDWFVSVFENSATDGSDGSGFTKTPQAATVDRFLEFLDTDGYRHIHDLSGDADIVRRNLRGPLWGYTDGAMVYVFESKLSQILQNCGTSTRLPFLKELKNRGILQPSGKNFTHDYLKVVDEEDKKVKHLRLEYPINWDMKIDHAAELREGMAERR